MNIYIVTNEYSIEGGGLAYSCHAFVNMLEQAQIRRAELNSRLLRRSFGVQIET